MIPDTMEASDTVQLQELCNKLDARDHWDYDEPATIAQAHEILRWLPRLSERLDKLESVRPFHIPLSNEQPERRDT